MKIISPRQTIETVRYELFFEVEPGAGYSFDCDKFGEVQTEDLSKSAKKTFKECLSRYGHPKVTEIRSSYRQPALGECECGRTVALEDPLTNECECGRLYNMAGHELAPRSLWEENYDDEY